ncbi:MAG: protein kinase [Myxococcota bacterium]
MNRSFGPYRLLRCIGEGGMAQVWSAQRETLGGPKTCAVKIIKPRYADEPGYREMFLREGRLALALSGHANVVSVFDVGGQDDQLYMAMEQIDGVTLSELTRSVDRPWPVEHAVYVAACVLRALVHLHGYRVGGVPQGVVHRDVTPHNVMVSSHGEITLMDFGIAQPVGSAPALGDALGKLGYVPREQVEGEPDERSDLYGVGALLFELLDGRRFRWHCADDDALFQEIYRDRVPSLRRTDVPEPVLRVLRSLLQPDRTHRARSAESVLRALEGWSGFQWAQSELAVIYRGMVGPSHSGHTGIVPAAVEQDSPVPRSSATSDSATRVSGRATSPRDPWNTSAPMRSGLVTAVHARSAANDSGRRAKARRDAEARADVALQALSEQPTDAQTRAQPSESSPAWRIQATTDENVDVSASPSSTPTEPVPAASGDTQVLPEAEQPLLDALATRRHPASAEKQNVPSSRRAAEIAVTCATPSRHAPWSADTDPLARQLVRAEPGAPVVRRRPHSGDVREETTGAVKPRQRQSAAMHRAAGAGVLRTKEVTGEVVAGEIVADETFGDPVWRVGSR